MRPIISLILTLVVAFVSACTPVRVSRPVVVGTPGPVYKSTDTKFSVVIKNNMAATLDIEAGQTVIGSIPSGGSLIVNLCDRNFWQKVLQTPGRQSRTNLVITAKAHVDSAFYGMVSRSFTADCNARAAQQKDWTVQSVTKVRKL